MPAPVGLASPKLVDVVTYEEKSATYRLLLVVDAPWDQSTAQLLALQEKLNNYIGFALDGPMAEKYPGSDGKDVLVRLQCRTAPTGRTQKTLAQMEAALKELGLGFEVVVGL
jgi:hypothetical protein